ncbi:hypothetical protein PINS_up005497 [Pythium insidiosum]|nr:hypothetical protein PINS_up005497 [Pythium insidiosum]
MRQRMSVEERRLRHREVQRRFMQRKLAKLTDLRVMMHRLERRYNMLQVEHEIKVLQCEQRELRSLLREQRKVTKSRHEPPSSPTSLCSVSSPWRWRDHEWQQVLDLLASESELTAAILT